MRLSEAIKLYNTKVRLNEILNLTEKYLSELELTDGLYSFRRERLVNLYKELLDILDIKNIIKQKIAAIDTLLDERYEGFDL